MNRELTSPPLHDEAAVFLARRFAPWCCGEDDPFPPTIRPDMALVETVPEAKFATIAPVVAARVRI